MIEVSDLASGVVAASCLCGQQGTIISAESHAEFVRASLLDLIEHARHCHFAVGGHDARVARLLAERFPKVP